MEAARNGASLVQQMLIFARRHPLQVRPTDLNRIVSSAVAMFSRSCPDPLRSALTWLRIWLGDSRRDAGTDGNLDLALNARDSMPSGAD